MAVYEMNALLTRKDEAGNLHLIYPITQLDCVDGAEDLLHYGAAQDLTDEEKAQARENIGVVGSDLSVNDQDAPGYVANRTHWKENGQALLDIQWDGNTEGRVTVSAAGVTGYKVSDLIVTDEELAACIAVWGDYSTLLGDDSGSIYKFGTTTVYTFGFMVVRSTEDALIHPDTGEIVYATETGIYFVQNSMGFMSRLYSDTVTVPTDVYHTLPVEYLPDYLHLPPVTAADAGKMITLVVDENGNWVREVTDKLSVATVEGETLIL